MSKPSSTIQDGSLDLLLDTICNTFGGIVFISMLVVVLLNMSGTSAETTTPSDESELEFQQLTADLDAARARLLSMRQSRQQREQTRSQLVNDQQRRLAKALLDAETISESRTEEVASQLSQASVSQQAVNRIAKTLNARQRELDEKSRVLDGLDQEVESQAEKLQQELKARSQNVTPPKLELLPNHRSISLLLKGGRLTTVSRIGATGDEIPNLGELQISQENGVDYVEAKVGSGVEVALDQSTKGQIQSLIKQFHPDKHVLKVWIWPDSFAHFQVVQNVIAESKCRSKPEPVKEGTRLSFGNVSAPVLGQ